MSPKHPWRLPALGSLIAVIAFGSWGCCTVKCCEKQPHNQLVLVGEGDKVSSDPIVISQAAGHEIAWTLPADSTIAYVAISLAEGRPVPFEGCTTTEGVCRIACEHRLCSSGPVRSAVHPPPDGIYYDYVFQHAGSASADPGIIIRP
jgi:hypothetical protein